MLTTKTFQLNWNCWSVLHHCLYFCFVACFSLALFLPPLKMGIMGRENDEKKRRIKLNKFISMQSIASVVTVGNLSKTHAKNYARFVTMIMMMKMKNIFAEKHLAKLCWNSMGFYSNSSVIFSPINLVWSPALLKMCVRRGSIRFWDLWIPKFSLYPWWNFCKQNSNDNNIKCKAEIRRISWSLEIYLFDASHLKSFMEWIVSPETRPLH